MICVLNLNENYSYDGEKTAPRIEPLQTKHADKINEVTREAFKDDPLHLYVKADSKDPGPKRRALDSVLARISLKHALQQKIGYVIDDGDAAILVTPAKSDISKPSPIGKIHDIIYGLFAKASLYLNTREQRKRIKEMVAKMDKLKEDILGDEAENMVYIYLLYVSPTKQGLGYGSALLETILFTADLKGQGVYLFSSKVATTFYPLFGFLEAGSLSLGDDNPTWQKEPVIVPLMVRKPRIAKIL